MRNRNKVRSILGALPDFRSGVTSEDDASRRQRKQIATRKKRFATLTALLFVVCGTLWLLYSARITRVVVVLTTVDGAYVDVNAQSVEESVNSYLNESFINRWRVDEAALNERILVENQSVSSTSVASNQAKVLEVNVQARKSAVVWEKDNSYYEVDATGHAFRESNKATYNQSVRVVDRSRISVEVGESLTTPQFMSLIDAISTLDSREDAFDIKHFIAPEAARELHFELQGRPFIVKAKIDSKPQVIVAGLRDSLRYFDANGVTPTQIIDLRVKGRAVYK